MVFSRKQDAFTLVELSIVMVIMALLAGAIVMGQNIIRNGQLNAITNERARYETAVSAFRDKYGATPGDMRDATSYFGRNNAACPTDGGTAQTYGTCNGNGNGQVLSGAANATAEMFQFWTQLSLGGFIEGKYSGLSGPAGISDALYGVNSPSGKMRNTMWSTLYFYVTAHPGYFDGMYGNAFLFGTDGSSGNNYTLGAALSPEEVRSIDVKIDDGKAALGDVSPYPYGNCTSKTDGTATTSTTFDAIYKINSPAVACAVVFRNQY